VWVCWSVVKLAVVWAGARGAFTLAIDFEVEFERKFSKFKDENSAYIQPSCANVSFICE
jgi:hypothetical protein